MMICIFFLFANTIILEVSLLRLFFNKKKTNLANTAHSAGIIVNGSPPQEMIDTINLVAQRLGYELSTGKTALDEETLAWADLIINVADDVQLDYIKNIKPIENWDITDASNIASTDSRVLTVKKIEKKVHNLLHRLANKSS